MSSVKPGGPKFLGPTSWRPKFLRWLSPLLLVSLGLHGLGLLVPVPEKPEDIARPEYIEPESIQVSTLPPIAEPAPEPEPPPPPPEPPPPPVEEPLPPVVEPLQETFPFEEDDFPEDTPPEDDLPEDDSPDEDDSNFEEPNNDEGDDDGNSDEGPVTQNDYQGLTDDNQSIGNSLLFSSKYPGKSVSTNIPLSLTYTAEKECFEPLPGAVQMGAAINTTGATEEIALFSSSGYPKLDEWIKGVLNSDNLPSEVFAAFEISSGSLSDWINETRSNGDDPIVPTGEVAKAYALEVIVTIDGNRCDDL